MERTRLEASIRTAVVVIGLMAAIWRPVQAATLTVTSTANSGAGSLRQAIADAVSGDTIDFALDGCPCTITLTSGELVIDKSLTIQGPGANLLAISGNSATRVFTVTADGVEMVGLHITRGFDRSYGGGGGVLVAEQASLTLRNALLASNQTYTLGGAIYSSGTLTIVDSTVAGNFAVSAGGGIYTLKSSSTVRSVNFVSNESRSGGAIEVNGGTMHVTGSTFSGNSGYWSGAVYVLSRAQVTIVGSSMTGNEAATYGGGISVQFGVVTISSSTISENSAATAGGGIHAYGSEVAVVNSTISANAAAQGGGVGTDSATVTIANSTIVRNQGGGVAENVQYNNTARPITLFNTIVAGNSVYDTSGLVNTNTSLIGGDPSTIFDPRLTDNGGPTKTHALVANSPAIGAGSNVSLPADVLDLDGDGDTSEPLPVDQRGPGFPRLQGRNVDIGAIEAACPVISVTPGSLPAATVGTAFSQALTAAGGLGPYTFSAISLPAGLTLSSAGVLGGTPTSTGMFTVAMMVTDERGCGQRIELTLTIVEDTTCGIQVTPATLPTPFVAIPYLQGIGTSASGKYTYSVTAGALPPGLQLASALGATGIIGIPQRPGTYSFTITAAKSGTNCRAVRTFTVTIPPTVVPLLTCVQKINNTTYRGTFGFENSTGASVGIPVGTNNYFTPGALNRGQATAFATGTTTSAFSVTFTASGNSNDLAVWFLRGPDGQKRLVTVTKATYGCQ